MGQERASVLYQRIINASAVLGFVVGFIIQSLYVAWGIVLVGTVLAFLVRFATITQVFIILLVY